MGSGKSSLLSAINREMIYVDPKYLDASISPQTTKQITTEKIREAPIELSGSISYVEQKIWVQNKTIRDIILFGKSYDQDFYSKVVSCCQLTRDFEILPAGDQTEIGEMGINLSGGQKARVSLARAVYADRDIMLMDTPLAALDANVKKKIFE